MGEGRDSILDRILEALFRAVKGAALSYLNRFLRYTTRLLLISVVGVVFVAAGLIFMLIGLVRLLSEVMPGWTAWEPMGLITVLIGVLLLMSLLRR